MAGLDNQEERFRCALEELVRSAEAAEPFMNHPYIMHPDYCNHEDLKPVLWIGKIIRRFQRRAKPVHELLRDVYVMFQHYVTYAVREGVKKRHIRSARDLYARFIHAFGMSVFIPLSFSGEAAEEEEEAEEEEDVADAMDVYDAMYTYKSL